MDEPITLDQLITELGGTPPEPETDPAPATESEPAPATDPAPETAPATDPTPEPTGEPKKTQQVQQTFAAMRVQNKQFADTLKDVAKLLDIPDETAADPAALVAAVQAKSLERQAQQTNVPVELLTRLQVLEQRDQEAAAKQLEATAAVWFQKVQDTYGLNQAQLSKFAEELIRAGMNPLEQRVDIMAQYKLLHHEELLAKAVQDAVAAEQARAAKATSRSTTPGTKQGPGSSGEPAKVNSVQQLNDWLAQNTKK